MHSMAAAGVGLALTQVGLGQESRPADELRLGLIGAGSQGRVLMGNCLKIPGVRFVAICDIWPYHQAYSANILKKYQQNVNVYADYQAMLDTEKSMDAVIVATPDWMHAEQTLACMKAGKHVYCEKEMSNSLESARKMVLAPKATGKLLQIGHQRRSNPRYIHALRLITKDRILGRITHINGQWNRSKAEPLGWPQGRELDEATLKRYGYEGMEQFRNWRWYRQYSGGAMADLGSHQVDIYNWFLGARPKAVQATGGLDYYKDRQWYDNVMALYDYQGPEGPVRAFYQVVNTSRYGGYFETFMGDEGTLVISEDAQIGQVFREPQAKKKEWEDQATRTEGLNKEGIQLMIGETRAADGQKDEAGQKMLQDSFKPPHQPHLENFFDAIRKGTPLTCPPEEAYPTAVTVLAANDAVATGKRIEFRPEDFRA